MPDGASIVRLPTDFDADWALAFLSARAVPGLESVGPGAYVRGIRIGRRRLTLACRFLTDAGGAKRLAIRSAPALSSADLRRLATRLFDLERDLAPFRRLARRDAVLRRLAPPSRGLRVLQFLDPFEALARAILGQQVSLAGARTLASRLARLVAPSARAAAAFPTALEVAEAGPRRLRRSERSPVSDPGRRPTC
jgi:AraC family transcriptional regulator of adaptative response / DNA-3-methyladenine glycosylase II